ncbi:MAG: SLAP domain-containing protein [Lactobacillus sp.]|nr:SLAP domain-containing protein [Lactobacillus sp.]
MRLKAVVAAVVIGLGLGSTAQTTAASTSYKATLGRRASVYNKKGKAIKFLGKRSFAKGAWFKAGKKKVVKIRGVRYYRISANVFLKVKDVASYTVLKPVKKATKKKVTKKTTKKKATAKAKKKKVVVAAKKSTDKKVVEDEPKLSERFDNLEFTYATANKPTYVYDAKNKKNADFYVSKGAVFNVWSSRYAYIDDKIQLEYQLGRQSYWILADDVDISGQPITPSNTYESVYKSITPATDKEKNALQATINSNVKDTDKYKLATLSLKKAYDKEVTKAQATLENSATTIKQAEDMNASLKQAASDLDGTRVAVSNPEQLTDNDIKEIKELITSMTDISNITYDAGQHLFTLTDKSGNVTTMSAYDLIAQAID